MIVDRMRRAAILRALTMLVLLACGAARAGGAAAGLANEHIIARCIHAASEGRPWLEKTLWGLRDQEGGWLGAERPNANGTHDLGPLQVNSWWVSRLAQVTGKAPLDVRWWLTNDACFNIQAARWIFLAALATTGDYWSAIGAYHSPTGWRRARYTAEVVRKLELRFGAGIFSSGRER